jgi:prepilin peptidase CpaA
MFSAVAANWTLVLCMVAFTFAAAVWDLRERRIPNALTLPVFAAGWVFQAVCHGWPGLADGALGFVAGGGGGDVKLMGALSVWLGYRLTLLVLIVSTVAVVVITIGVVMWQAASRGPRKMKEQYLATGKGTGRPETVRQRQERRIVAYAVPVAVATWLVLAWKIPSMNRQALAREAPAPAAVPARAP